MPTSLSLAPVLNLLLPASLHPAPRHLPPPSSSQALGFYCLAPLFQSKLKLLSDPSESAEPALGRAAGLGLAWRVLVSVPFFPLPPHGCSQQRDTRLWATAVTRRCSDFWAGRVEQCTRADSP